MVGTSISINVTHQMHKANREDRVASSKLENSWIFGGEM